MCEGVNDYIYLKSQYDDSTPPMTPKKKSLPTSSIKSNSTRRIKSLPTRKGGKKSKNKTRKNTKK